MEDFKQLLRGGSWIYGPRICRSACRYCDLPDFRDNMTGFRIVCTMKPQPKLMRGGAWDYGAGGCRSACRGRFAPAPHMYFIGFRIVC